ncbi:PPE family protein PPE28 [Mycobacterium tuberculosis H37Rv] [Mycobacterium shimoidei]|uniref:PPE family protein PPE28 [Mycobacterium tuberculosis H37Rv] n=2 Tax=Mycobacterium shimoidei TaxID=29313 RepID=A0A375YV39_MYCSH|nr:PPE family protein PPE28 [Mycobacterium tuberculosis H37Rv] [Mycobacterium shimoidei]
MTGGTLRWLTVGLLSTAGAGMISLTSMTGSAIAFADAPTPPGEPPFPNENVSWVELMGGSGTPIPQEGFNGAYMADVFTRFIQPNFPSVNFDSPCPSAPCDVNGLFTPEGLYPLTGIKDLTLDVSVDRGVDILTTQILNDLADPNKVPDGGTLGVFGYSQSSVISSLVMHELADKGVDPSQVNFVLIGDPMNPNGGILERFAGFTDMNGQMFNDPQLVLPSLGLTFYGATPDDLYPTTIYTLEYDGYADFPKYPLNFLADLNALLGLGFGNPSVHGSYPILSDEQLASAVLLPTDGTTSTTYYMIPSELPLITALGTFGVPQPFLDLIEPDLKILVDLGYGGDQLDPDNLLAGGFANVPTPFGLFPDVDPTQLFNDLVTGAQQGFAAFQEDLTNPAAWMPTVDFDLSDVLSAEPLATPSVTDIANAISAAFADAYAVFLPLGDISNALSTSVPAYDLALFTEALQNGDFIDAIGLPIAANTAIYTVATGFSFFIIQNALDNIMEDLAPLGF